MTISEAVLVSRARPLMEAELDREMVGLNMDSGLCYGFNETAATIWRHLEQPLTFGALLSRVEEEFDVDAARCRADVTALLAKLQDESLVTIAEPR